VLPGKGGALRERKKEIGGGRLLGPVGLSDGWGKKIRRKNKDSLVPLGDEGEQGV